MFVKRYQPTPTGEALPQARARAGRGLHPTTPALSAGLWKGNVCSRRGSQWPLVISTRAVDTVYSSCTLKQFTVTVPSRDDVFIHEKTSPILTCWKMSRRQKHTLWNVLLKCSKRGVTLSYSNLLFSQTNGKADSDGGEHEECYSSHQFRDQFSSQLFYRTGTLHLHKFTSL